MRRITFDVSPEVAVGLPLDPIDLSRSFTPSFRGPIEAMWQPSASMVAYSENHALLRAVHDAFYLHYPLVLSPDVIWLTIARGFGLHVNLHAEELRHRFVSHSGREQLKVERRDFLPGRANPWPEAFEAFSKQIEQRVGDLCNLIRCNFSTTGPVERAVSELMVMDAFKAYFEYAMSIGCGIPSITLTGTVGDWRSIRERAKSFGAYGLEDWCKALDQVLEQFVAASSGNADIEFWKSIFRYNSGSGPSVMTGWMTVFFPYIFDLKKNLLPNPFFKDWHRRLEIDDSQHFRERWADPQGIGMWAYPPCITDVPLKIEWGEQECNLRLAGGLMGVAQAKETLELQPECGWVIYYESDEPRPSSERASILDGSIDWPDK